MRYLLLALFVGIVGYAVGVLSGYRTATVDYVENGAQNIQKLAASMYDSPIEQKAQIAEVSDEDPRNDSDGDTDGGNTDGRGFQ